MELFHFDPAPDLASQDGGSDYSYSSNSSSVVHNFLSKKSSEKFHFLIYWGLFYTQKGQSDLLCSYGTSLKRDILNYNMIVQNSVQRCSYSRSRPFFFTALANAKKGGSGSTTLVDSEPMLTRKGSTPQHCLYFVIVCVQIILVTLCPRSFNI